MGGSGRTFSGRALASGSASGVALVLEEPLSLWGGLDPVTGRVVDRRHPQVGEEAAGRVLVMPSGRGSSSSSSVLAEAVRAGSAPAAIVLREPDEIVALGALVAEELYGRACPVVSLPEAAFGTIQTGDRVVIGPGGDVRVG